MLISYTRRMFLYTHMCVYPVYMRIIIANICIYIYIIHIQYTYCTCILYTIVSSSDVY